MPRRRHGFPWKSHLTQAEVAEHERLAVIVRQRGRKGLTIAERERFGALSRRRPVQTVYATTLTPSEREPSIA